MKKENDVQDAAPEIPDENGAGPEIPDENIDEVIYILRNSS